MAATASLLALPASAGIAGQADELVVVTPTNASGVTSKKPVEGGPAKLLISGGHVVHSPWDKERPKLEFDAFYCHVGCEGGIVPSYLLEIDAEKGGELAPLRRSSLTGYIEPKYNAAHRYEVPLADLDLGKLRFVLLLPKVEPAKGLNYTFSGSYRIQIVSGTVEPDLPVSVEFRLRISGLPNLPTKGDDTAGKLKSTTLIGKGTATFTKKFGKTKLVEATKTSGKITSVDVFKDGTEKRIEFGIISRPALVPGFVGTFYSPDTHRLLLMLNVRESNDDDCPKGKLTIATLTLVPVGGWDAPKNAAVLKGIPYSRGEWLTSTTPCTGHSHGWQTNNKKRVYVRLAVDERG